MVTRFKTTIARLLCVIYVVVPKAVVADCLAPPTAPILRIDIRDCEIAAQFDNTLRVTGDARQVLTMHYPYASKSGNIEFVLEDNVVTDRKFWITVAPGKSCSEFLEEAEEVWLFGDVCNDTGQNIPGIQIMPLRPEIKQDVLELLAASLGGET